MHCLQIVRNLFLNDVDISAQIFLQQIFYVLADLPYRFFVMLLGRDIELSDLEFIVSISNN